MERTFITTYQKLTKKAQEAEPKDIEFVERAGATYLKHPFGRTEIDLCAGNLIRFFQQEGRWRSFTQLELEAFYASQGLDDVFNLGMFYGLAEDWEDDLGEYRGDFVRVTVRGDLMVTDEFILICVGFKQEFISALKGELP